MNSASRKKRKDTCEDRCISIQNRWTGFERQPALARYVLIAVLALGWGSPFYASSNAISQTAPELTQASLPQGVEVRIEAEPKTATVGDLIRIDLDVTLPVDCRLEIPHLNPQTGDFVIIDFSPGPVVAEDGNSQRPSPTKNDDLKNHRARIIAAVYKTGTFEFPPIPLILKTPEGQEIAFSSPPMKIEIRSVLAENDQNLKDLKKQADIHETARWILWVALALATCILGAMAWHLWRRRPRQAVSPSPAPGRDPLEVAEEELRALLARGHPDGSRVKQFYITLSEIVKRILESGYEIQTAEKTTSEIMIALGRNPVLDAENLEKIEFFLIECDMVKFAKYLPSESEHDGAGNSAFEILEEAKAAVRRRRSSVINEPVAANRP